MDDKTWLVLREPGCVPERKGPFTTGALKKTLIEFMDARPSAFITRTDGTACPLCGRPGMLDSPSGPWLCTNEGCDVFSFCGSPTGDGAGDEAGRLGANARSILPQDGASPASPTYAPWKLVRFCGMCGSEEPKHKPFCSYAAASPPVAPQAGAQCPRPLCQAPAAMAQEVIEVQAVALVEADDRASTAERALAEAREELASTETALDARMRRIGRGPRADKTDRPFDPARVLKWPRARSRALLGIDLRSDDERDGFLVERDSARSLVTQYEAVAKVALEIVQRSVFGPGIEAGERYARYDGPGRFLVDLSEALASLYPAAGRDKPCTCHPDDNPPRPCPRKYALSECRAAALGSNQG